MSENKIKATQKNPLENFLLGNSTMESMSPCKETDSMDVENCPELGEIRPDGHQMSSSSTLSQFRSSSTLTVCPSPQLASSPHSGSKSVPPYFPSPTHPTSPCITSPSSNPALCSWASLQFKKTPSKTSPRQFQSDNESSYSTKRGHNMLLQRSLSSTFTKGWSNKLYVSSRTSNQNPLIQRRLAKRTYQSGHSRSDDGIRSTSLSPYSLQYVDMNHNVVPENLNLLSSQNQSVQRQSHFLSQSPSTRSNSNLEQPWSQESLPHCGSPNNSSQGGAVVSPPGAQSDCIFATSQERHDRSSVNVTVPLASHSRGQSLSPEASQSPLQSSGNNQAETEYSQVSPVSFAQSYTTLTPWTTRLASDCSTSLLNVSEEALQLSLGISDNLLLSASAKEIQPQSEQSYSTLNQPYSSLQPSTTHDSEDPPSSVKDVYKAMPNKQLRFRKTADALQKSGLWEVAMKTGNLIKRNKELQKELDKFRADALVFLKSVIKHPHNWKLIKTILSQALSSNQTSSKASPIMTVVVSAAEAAAAASAKLDSAGSSNGSSSSSLCGNASDSSGNSNHAFDTAIVDGHFSAGKNDFSCIGVAMDVN
ncbi:CLOCK-interacting pacemaker [Elysia marginata]|uniref:CLOCK-interacting pacemaker n=1 Tax=Elysia marginata TaxID=1093978 RepID=A0AAV4IJU4_9GAST|nr:CLOCK-interacting pacemaker [Elysia marginata]